MRRRPCWWCGGMFRNFRTRCFGGEDQVLFDGSTGTPKSAAAVVAAEKRGRGRGWMHRITESFIVGTGKERDLSWENQIADDLL